MSQSLTTNSPLSDASAVRPVTIVDSQIDELSRLVDSAQTDSLAIAADAADPPDPVADEQDLENRLAQVRLGLASSLFTALRLRDAATAAHSVRVALRCSAWSLALDLPEDERDSIEVAALLHDIGKIGVPDCVLLKPASLTNEDRAIMDRHRQFGLEILESCCAKADVLSIIRHVPDWFNGSRATLSGHDGPLPLGARLLMIVDAFDSMTTPQVYRPAMSRDQAVRELCDFAGIQFDPQLVCHFAQLQTTDQQRLHVDVARRWLKELSADHRSAGWWRHQPVQPSDGLATRPWLHQQRLLENMYDGVIFLDANLQVVLWNRGAERMTGVAGTAIFQRPFEPGVVKMRDERGHIIPDQKCPVAYAIRTGVQSLRRLVISSRNGCDLAVDAHMIPVVGPDGVTQGVTVLLHDASGEASLEERCHHLYEQAIRDPLTQLANRAEFDRVHSLFVEAHLERRLPCSLIMCDVDHFKVVNDTYGHPAGDQAIRSLAQLMKNMCRPGDLVARYGGEEFVILCADCNNETASARAEQLRRAFSDLPQQALGGKRCTASFGITEIQPGDNALTMLNRADRALLMAKQGGRNRVVQLGSGMIDEPLEARRSWWFWPKDRAGPLVDKYLVTNVPLDITVEKLRGFIADHQAQILSIDGGHVDLVIESAKMDKTRRRSDKSLSLLVELTFAQEERVAVLATQSHHQQPLKHRSLQTRIRVVLRPRRKRERRTGFALEHAQRVLSSLRSYLMASDAVAAGQAAPAGASSAAK
jgi:diguanylate cyclase (GGDEF)-like protein